MMLTEPEARGHWCPFSRVGGTCMASKCAAWRWAERHRGKIVVHQPLDADGFPLAPGAGHPEPERPAHVPAHWTWHPPERGMYGYFEQPADEMSANDRRGYCGLAGTPQF